MTYAEFVVAGAARQPVFS